jgi:5-dehydro-4-deoxyglucarate dehydratase
MSRMTPAEMAQQLGGGLLSFPVTHFDAQLKFQEEPYREHCAWMLERELAGLFAAGGTGEFFSLRPEEVAAVVRAAVAETNGKIPVIAGCGYGTAIATDLAQSAEKEGADGVLLLPPYLMNSTQDGLAAHVEAVCKSTSLGVIVYNRDNAILNEDTLEKLCARNANLVGFKDGVGDIELMMRVYARMGDRLTYIGGLPTAETFALPYLEMGVTTYSSAIFNFMPEWALSFYKAVRAEMLIGRGRGARHAWRHRGDRPVDRGRAGARVRRRRGTRTSSAPAPWPGPPSTATARRRWKRAPSSSKPSPKTSWPSASPWSRAACWRRGLPRARVEGERGRTVGQLRMFAGVVRSGDFLEARIDPAQPERTPLPRVDLRLRNIPLGPVAVFGASNFPLAFSVAGGDTASALAAGCPVIVKAHSAHPGTSELVGRAIQQAVRQCGLPEGSFSLLFDSGRSIGQGLVADHRIKAVGFTGSRTGGTALIEIAAARREPIPVYAEMSSINPVLLFPHALANRAEAIGRGFVASLVMGAGQFCTNPGLLLAVEGPGLDSFLAAARAALESQAAATMLTPGIHRAYEAAVVDLAGHAAVTTEARGAAGAFGQGQAAIVLDHGRGLHGRCAPCRERCSAPPRCWCAVPTWRRCTPSSKGWRGS